MKLDEIFVRCYELSLRKRKDYTSHEVNNHENFIRSSEIASWFSRSEDQSYAILIGTKLARLASLRTDDREPNNESINDTLLDLVNYCALFAERISEDANKKQGTS